MLICISIQSRNLENSRFMKRISTNWGRSHPLPRKYVQFLKTVNMGWQELLELLRCITYTYVYIYMYTYIYICIYVDVYIYTYVYILYICIYVDVYIYTHYVHTIYTCAVYVMFSIFAPTNFLCRATLPQELRCSRCDTTHDWGVSSCQRPGDHFGATWAIF